MILTPIARRAGLVASIVTAFAGMAHADEAHRVRGTIDHLSGDTLTVNTREGETVDIALQDGWKVSGVAKAELSDIGTGDFVGIASLPTDDGSDGALEVLIFPANMAGTGEGSYPWDLQPGSTMTNATVADKVQGVDGSTVTVTYDGGQSKEIAIPEGTPIVTFAEASTSDLVEGATVFVPARKDGDMIATKNVVVGKDGVVPPM